VLSFHPDLKIIKQMMRVPAPRSALNKATYPGLYNAENPYIIDIKTEEYIL